MLAQLDSQQLHGHFVPGAAATKPTLAAPLLAKDLLEGTCQFPLGDSSFIF